MAIKFARGDRDRLYAFANEHVRADDQFVDALKAAAEDVTAHLEAATQAYYGSDLGILKSHGFVTTTTEVYTNILPENVRNAISIANARHHWYWECTLTRPVYASVVTRFHPLALDPAPFLAHHERLADQRADLAGKINAYKLLILNARNWDEVLAVWPAAGKVMDTGMKHPVPSPLTQSILDMIKADNAGK